jgi:membrane fusion protein, peptide pheromone/bacteriocin exporter
MKAIIQDIHDITDSRELLEAEPHPFPAFFIYLLLAIVIIALLWCYFGEIDIVIKANGVIRPAQKISTIRNQIAGKVTNVYYENGQRVRQGDLLLVIEHNGLNIEKSAITEQLHKTRDELYNLKILQASILNNQTAKQSRTLFKADSEEYYYRYLDYISNVSKLTSAVKQKQENYLTLQKLLVEGAVADNDVKNVKDALNSAELDLQIYKNKYLLDIQNNIVSDETALNSIEKNLKSTSLSIEDSAVTASLSGIVNVITEINKGDLLQSGVDLATIVPETNGRYLVQLYISNGDISGIKQGDQIKYHFLALPYQEYGELKGKIINIGTDSRMDLQKSENFYLVEATIENKPLYNYKGVKAELKVGMQCEAQVITKTKKILYYLLEKINLMN